jgi:uncharacterized protein (TIGR03437 family)
MYVAVRSVIALVLVCHAVALAQTDPFLVSAWQILNADLFLMAVDGNGDVYVAGRTNEAGFRSTPGAFQTNPGGGTCQSRLCNDVVVAKIRALDGRVVAATLFGGSGEDAPTALYIDRSSGAVYLAGSTTSRNLSTSEGAFQRTTRSVSTSFVAKFNSTLTTREFATYLGGSSTDRISVVTVDNQGFVYVAGVTESRDFPTTPGAYRATHASGMIFVSRLNAAGTALVGSTFLGQGTVAGISLDTFGNVVVTGTTSSDAFPVTENAYQTRPRRTPAATDADGFVTRLPVLLNAAPVYSTVLRGSQNDSIVDSDVDDAGNVYVAGTSFSRDFPLTNADAAIGEAGAVFVAKFSATGLVYSRALRGNNTVTATGIEVIRDGTVNVSGFSNGTHFATTAGAYRRCAPPVPLGSSTPFYTRLDGNGGIVYSTLLHDSVYESRQWFATLPSGEVYTLSFTPSPDQGPIISTQPPPNTLRRLNPTAAAPRVDCVVNAATYAPGAVSPGLIVTIFGSGMGPGTGVGGAVENGRVTASAAGVRVLFDGVAAPILYAREDQINAIVPFSLPSRPTTAMIVEVQGTAVGSATLAVRAASPGIFRLGSTEHAVILNEDNTVNTPDNPAARASLITFWITGFAEYVAPFGDGVVATDISPVRLPVTLGVQNQAADVLYAGAAPGMVAGAAQVNARIPAAVPVSLRVPLTLTVGSDVVRSAAFVSVK